jgi:hypothetical protein
MYDREDLRNRRWTRAQINALPSDLVIQPSEINHQIESRRLWDRQRVEQIDQQPEWKERRAKLDAASWQSLGWTKPPYAQSGEAAMTANAAITCQGGEHEHHRFHAAKPRGMVSRFAR